MDSAQGGSSISLDSLKIHAGPVLQPPISTSPDRFIVWILLAAAIWLTQTYTEWVPLIPSIPHHRISLIEMKPGRRTRSPEISEGRQTLIPSTTVSASSRFGTAYPSRHLPTW